MRFVAILGQLCEIATSQNIRSPETKCRVLHIFFKIHVIVIIPQIISTLGIPIPSWLQGQAMDDYILRPNHSLSSD